MNCSTAAARHLASSGVDVYTALSGAVGALYGPLHGGANEAVLKMLNEIGSVENIPEFIEGVKNRKRKMSGFGHRVYKNYDPRAKVIKNWQRKYFQLLVVIPSSRWLFLWRRLHCQMSILSREGYIQMWISTLV
uniref:Citrate synthase n=1 Tax=Cannabis sativa TaxID=3483 RepID=A0A803RBF3_CANSA